MNRVRTYGGPNINDVKKYVGVEYDDYYYRVGPEFEKLRFVHSDDGVNWSYIGNDGLIQNVRELSYAYEGTYEDYDNYGSSGLYSLVSAVVKDDTTLRFYGRDFIVDVDLSTMNGSLVAVDKSGGGSSSTAGPYNAAIFGKIGETILSTKERTARPLNYHASARTPLMLNDLELNSIYSYNRSGCYGGCTAQSDDYFYALDIDFYDRFILMKFDTSGKILEINTTVKEGSTQMPSLIYLKDCDKLVFLYKTGVYVYDADLNLLGQKDVGIISGPVADAGNGYIVYISGFEKAVKMEIANLTFDYVASDISGLDRIQSLNYTVNIGSSNDPEYSVDIDYVYYNQMLKLGDTLLYSRCIESNDDRCIYISSDEGKTWSEPLSLDGSQHLWNYTMLMKIHD